MVGIVVADGLVAAMGGAVVGLLVDGLVAAMGGAIEGLPAGEDLLFMLGVVTLGMWNVAMWLPRMFRILLVNIAFPSTPCI